jgi:hypothetical protein
MNITSELYSLEKIVRESPNWEFNVPLYQRLYVWGDEQVETLLADLCGAFERGEPLFYLGGTLLVEQESRGTRRFDLVDGQQRFTTLWLLCHAWGHALEPFLRVDFGEGSKPRVEFAIRPEVNRFLRQLMEAGHGEIPGDLQASRRMRTALDLMARRADERVGYLAKLTEYVFASVRFVITKVPRQTDLNKLFEVINNRGVQLQHHQILKARMLEHLPEQDRAAYAILWDACADMNAFAEDTVCAVSGVSKAQVTGLYESGGGLEDAQAMLAAVAPPPGQGHLDGAASLAEVLAQASLQAAAVEVKEADDRGDVRSIVGFPLFLQHTLRIWLFDHSRADLPRVLDRELLSLFQTHFLHAAASNDVKLFIGLLWKLRVLFDRHVIKWVDKGEEEVHMICRISVSTSDRARYMTRSREDDAHRGMVLLQGMLYHSQEITTHYWLTPLLHFMHMNRGQGDEGFFLFLRHLDNHLLASDAEEHLAERTLSFMRNPWQRRNLVHRDVLVQELGTRFPHYWFYKLEFVLWQQGLRQNDGWNSFRMTAKSSVEHVSPQNPTEYDRDKVDKALHRFGNLALVSRSVNSEYGNLPFNEKRQRFLNRNAARLDSLKLALVYESENWGDTQAFEHEAQMVEALDAYARDTEAQVGSR